MPNAPLTTDHVAMCECGRRLGSYDGHPDWCPCSPSHTFAARTTHQMKLKLRGGQCWLIECGNPPRYFGGDPGDWCDNPNHAHRYDSLEAATWVSDHYINTMEERRVVQHSWG